MIQYFGLKMVKTKMIRISRASCWYNAGTGTNDDFWLICQYNQPCCYVAYTVKNDNGIITIENAEVAGPDYAHCPPDENNNNCTVLCNYYEPPQKISVNVTNENILEAYNINIISNLVEMKRKIFECSILWNSNSIFV